MVPHGARGIRFRLPAQWNARLYTTGFWIFYQHRRKAGLLSVDYLMALVPRVTITKR
jgi:hypothetical protein